MPLRFRRTADEDLQRIFIDGVEQFGAVAAERYADRLRRGCELLSEFPRMGRDRHHPRRAVRSFPCGAHIIVYELDEDDTVIVLRVRHGREDWTGDPL